MRPRLTGNLIRVKPLETADETKSSCDPPRPPAHPPIVLAISMCKGPARAHRVADTGEKRSRPDSLAHPPEPRPRVRSRLAPSRSRLGSATGIRTAHTGLRSAPLRQDRSRPVCAQGSRVTTTVALEPAHTACANATRSACGPPTGWWPLRRQFAARPHDGPDRGVGMVRPRQSGQE